MANYGSDWIGHEFARKDDEGGRAPHDSHESAMRPPSGSQTLPASVIPSAHRVLQIRYRKQLASAICVGPNWA